MQLRINLRSISLVMAPVLMVVASDAALAGVGGQNQQADLSLHGLWSSEISTVSWMALQDEEEVLSESTSITTTEETREEGLVLSGPYFLRSADPAPAGEIELKFIYGYKTTSDESDENELEFEFEWGITDDIEFLFSVPVELGNGRVGGNADITLGLHTRFWKEDGWLPAFAMRNQIRVPSGYHSSGVDYIARGLITKTIIPGTLRAHANPFIKLVNGHIVEDARHFQWGVAVGVDWQVSDDLVFIADYQHRSGEEDGQRNNHSMEFGADWTIAEHQKIGFQTEVGLDGDSHGENWGFRVSYILEIAGPKLGGS